MIVRSGYKKLITAILTASLIATCLTGCGKLHSSKDKTLSDKVDEYVMAFNKAVTDYKINGTILISKNNDIVFNHSYGKADFENNIGFTDDTVFRVASITKLFTAVAIMQLYEKGKLDLTDPISKYIPGQTRGDEITIHSLLTHTSGVVREAGLDAYGSYSKEQVISSIIKKSLIFEPGTDIEYSNAGYNLLAAVVEKVSEMTYSDYIKENIFIPAGMKSSGCDSGADSIPNLASGYEYNYGKFNKKREFNLSFAFGAGDIYSTAIDMFKFDKALHTGTLLTKQSVEKMFQNNAGIIKYGAIFGYGSNCDKLNGHRWYGKSGNLSSFASYYVRFPEEKTTIIILLNTWFPVNEQLKTIIGAIATGEPYKLPSVKKETKLDKALLKKYEGKYESKADTFIHLKAGRFIQLTSDGSHLVDKKTTGYDLNFVSSSKKEFYVKGIEFLECKFKTSITGKVTGLTISNGTEKVFFKKVK